MNRTRTLIAALFVAGLLAPAAPAFSETTALAEDPGAPTPLEQQIGSDLLARRRQSE